MTNSATFPDSATASLSQAVAAFAPPGFDDPARIMTRSDVEEYFLGLLAAAAIEADPGLCLALLEHAQNNALRCSASAELALVLRGDNPVSELARRLRSHPACGQLLRSRFPWPLVIPESDRTRQALVFAASLAPAGWLDEATLFPS